MSSDFRTEVIKNREDSGLQSSLGREQTEVKMLRRNAIHFLWEMKDGEEKGVEGDWKGR